MFAVALLASTAHVLRAPFPHVLRAPPPQLTVAAPTSISAKESLLAAISTYNAATASDGIPSVDFGVSGGELDKDSRAPRDLLKAGAYYGVSDAVGKAAGRTHRHPNPDLLSDAERPAFVPCCGQTPS